MVLKQFYVCITLIMLYMAEIQTEVKYSKVLFDTILCQKEYICLNYTIKYLFSGPYFCLPTYLYYIQQGDFLVISTFCS